VSLHLDSNFKLLIYLSEMEFAYYTFFVSYGGL